MLGLDNRLHTYWPTKLPKWRCNKSISADQTCSHCVPVASPESLGPGALKPVKFGLGCKGNKCSDTGTGDLSVLPALESSPIDYTTKHTPRYGVPGKLSTSSSRSNGLSVRFARWTTTTQEGRPSRSTLDRPYSTSHKCASTGNAGLQKYKVDIAWWRVTLKSHWIRNFHLI